MTHASDSHVAKILAILKGKRRATNLELMKITPRAAARINDIKREGHLVRSVHVKGPLWVYIYDGEETPVDN